MFVTLSVLFMLWDVVLMCSVCEPSLDVREENSSVILERESESMCDVVFLNFTNAKT